VQTYLHLDGLRRGGAVDLMTAQVEGGGLSGVDESEVVSSGGTMGTTASSGMRVGSSLKAMGYASGLVFSSGSVDRQW
jgi:hypothetical protein